MVCAICSVSVSVCLVRICSKVTSLKNNVEYVIIFLNYLMFVSHLYVFYSVSVHEALLATVVPWSQNVGSR